MNSNEHNNYTPEAPAEPVSTSAPPTDEDVVASSASDVWTRVEDILRQVTRDFDDDLLGPRDAKEWRSELLGELRVACDVAPSSHPPAL